MSDDDSNQIQKIDLDKVDWKSSREFFESLGEELDKLDNKDEAYDFTWVGKRKAIIEAGAPINKTLRPNVKESKDWDTTENLFIEGDNLDALKLLQESYLGKVKMIYIDPPYNTGRDFVYHDNFKASTEDYDEDTEYKDESGNIQFKKNEKTNGRYHSDWLSMMYPRLKLARNLLSSDGAIFVSIGEDEQANLQKLCNEVFGEDNHITNYVWHNNVKGRQMDLHIKNTYENILVYAKSSADLVLNNEKSDIDTSKMLNDDISHYKKGYPLHNGTADFHINNRPNLAYSIYYNPSSGDAKTIDEKIGDRGNFSIGDPSKAGQKLLSSGYVRIIPKFNATYNNQRVWRWGAEKFSNEYKSELLFVEESDGYYIYGKDRVIDGVSEKKPKNYINIDGGSAKKDLANLLEPRVFDNPKPVKLISELLKIGSDDECIIIDFFSGSATTAHAALLVNAQDGGNRKWIMVQLPESTEGNAEAIKAGYKSIPEISRDRIRKAGEKIAKDYSNAKVDYGFRALSVADTNYKEVFKPVGEHAQESLLDTVDNVKEDRSELDLLYGVLVQSALELNRPIEKKEMSGADVYLYDYFGEVSGLAACFADSVPEETIKEIAKLKPLTAVFKDSSFESSQDKVNLAEHFRIISPDTKVKVV